MDQLFARYLHARVGRRAFVVYVKLAEPAPRVAEGGKLPVCRYARDARQLFHKVVRVTFAVVHGMEDAVDIVEKVVHRYLFAVRFGEMAERGV